MDLIGRFFALIALIAFGFSGPVSAHHSHGNYQIGVEIQVHGVVSVFHFANPHVWVFMDVETKTATPRVGRWKAGEPAVSAERDGMK